MLLRRFSKHVTDQNWFAVGLDVLVVMVGIFLGIQVNNWNVSQNDLVKEQEILQQLKSEYEDNLIQLDQKIAHRKFMLKSFHQLFNYIDNPIDVDQDAFMSEFNVIIGSPTFDPIQNNLINSGNIELIRNRNLKRLLILWPSSTSELKYAENQWFKILFENIVPSLTNIGILRNVFYEWWNDERNLKWISDDKIDKRFKTGKSTNIPTVSELLKNKEIEGILSVATSLNLASNAMSQILRKRILEILDLLNQEIKAGE